MPEHTPRGTTTAYICECGKKWVFSKADVAGTPAVQRPCACGRTLVVGKGVIYANTISQT
jgi:hypothetical protein